MNITNAASASSPNNLTDAELFQLATAATLRALGRAPTHEVVFGRLWQSGPEQTEFPVIADDTILRGLSDLEAAKLRFGFEYKKRFDKPLQNEFFSFLEQARSAACLGGLYLGAKENITHVWNNDPQIDFKNTSLDEPPDAVLNELIRHARQLWLNDIPVASNPQVIGFLELLKTEIDDPIAFEKTARQFIFGLWQNFGNQSDAPSSDQATPRAVSSNDEAPDPAPDDKTTLEAAPQEKSENEIPPQGGTQGDETQLSAKDSTADDGLNPIPPNDAMSTTAALARYRVYNTGYDEVTTADKLVETRDRQKLRVELENQLQPFQRLVQKLAQKLQRQLQSFQDIGWQRGLEDGTLDLQRLTRVYAHKLGVHFIYKQPQMGLARDSVVTLLLDNSGSMRGRPIMVTALCADILARTLERCGVKVEILGYTTKQWKGGQPYKEWMSANKPPHPGRLNELRHIVYKAADQSWRQSRLNIAAMLKEGLLKENIDGEALLWAHRRLAKRAERRKILMVISDGAPVDDATLTTNAPDYLEQHLHDTVAWISEQKKVELVAIGIGHDVTRYYPRATVIRDAGTLAETMLQQLGKLLKA